MQEQTEVNYMLFKIAPIYDYSFLDSWFEPLIFSIPNIVYIMRKELDNEKIKEISNTLTSIFTVVDLRESDLIKGADLDFSDYEDALQSVCASRVKANYIVTRNIKDFKNSTVPAIKPSELFDRI